jgi:hypothetical protein
MEGWPQNCRKYMKQGQYCPKYAHHKSFWQKCGHYRYAFKRYTLGNIRKISWYFIICSDLDLANINLNITYIRIYHTCSHDGYHFCYNQSINNDLMPFTQTLTSLCDLDFGSRDLDSVRNKLHNGEHLCKVTLKSPDDCRSSAPNKHFSINVKCDLNL